jgi:hypothetical protein
MTRLLALIVLVAAGGLGLVADPALTKMNPSSGP